MYDIRKCFDQYRTLGELVKCQQQSEYSIENVSFKVTSANLQKKLIRGLILKQPPTKENRLEHRCNRALNSFCRLLNTSNTSLTHLA